MINCITKSRCNTIKMINIWEFAKFRLFVNISDLSVQVIMKIFFFSLNQLQDAFITSDHAMLARFSVD